MSVSCRWLFAGLGRSRLRNDGQGSKIKTDLRAIARTANKNCDCSRMKLRSSYVGERLHPTYATLHSRLGESTIQLINRLLKSVVLSPLKFRKLSFWMPNELEALLKYNGLTIETKLGNYDKESFTKERQRAFMQKGRFCFPSAKRV
ncbi:MAG: hypothetical protein V7L21_28125 [Nostoc sp.]|uniref:hypothetical protein n=1 Tax=Nostoc sp. TaxID=1180 RepID=UPI002FFA23B1